MNNKRINDIRVFNESKTYRSCDKYIYAGVYYNHSLKLKILKKMLEITVKNKSQPKGDFFKDK